MNPTASPSKQKRDIIHYTSIGTQVLAGLALAICIGLRADKILQTLPLFSSALPLLVLFGIFYNLLRETGKKKHNGQK